MFSKHVFTNSQIEHAELRLFLQSLCMRDWACTVH